MVRAPTEDPQENDRPAERHRHPAVYRHRGVDRLIDELGENGYLRALAEDRRLLRGAFSANGGVEVDTQGDAFLYAFDDPPEWWKRVQPTRSQIVTLARPAAKFPLYDYSLSAHCTINFNPGLQPWHAGYGELIASIIIRPVERTEDGIQGELPT
jgi:hypothetical protein